MKVKKVHSENFHIHVRYVDEGKRIYRKTFITILMLMIMIPSIMTASASSHVEATETEAETVEPESISGRVAATNETESEKNETATIKPDKKEDEKEVSSDEETTLLEGFSSTDHMIRYTSDYVNVRKTPAIEDNNVIEILSIGEEVTVVAESEGWSEVMYQKRTGYISSDLLQDEKPDLYRYHVSDDEFSVLCRIVEAEVTGDVGMYHGVTEEDLYISKIRIAQNILNRVDCPQFPDNIIDVVFERNQYSPISDGRYYDVNITDMTVDACKAALLITTPDYTEGALYFRADGGYFPYGEYLFTDSIGVSYFGSYACDCHP